MFDKDSEDDDDKFTREALTGFIESVDEDVDTSIERATLALMDLEGHSAFTRSNSFAFLYGMFGVTLRVLKLTDDFLQNMYMVADRVTDIAPEVFTRVEEAVAYLLQNMDTLGDNYDDTFVKTYFEYIKLMAEELYQGQPAPLKYPPNNPKGEQS